MFFILFIAIVVIMYIGTFKDNFTKEKIDKVTPVLAISMAAILFMSIVLNLLN
jgi:hypothetical protein